MKPDWLKNNITSILAVVWSIAIIGLLFTALFKEVKSDEKLTYIVVSNAVNIAMLILGYYYVSSKLSHDKARAELEMKRMQEEKTTTAATITTEIKTEDATTNDK